jgi:hypothetical protein
MEIKKITLQFTGKEILGVAEEIIMLVNFYFKQNNFETLQDFIDMIDYDTYKALNEIARIGYYDLDKYINDKINGK